MVEWSKGYTASYYAERVDPATWRDVGVIGITGGTIKREQTGKRQSADINCVNYRIPIEQWIRIYLDVQQEGASAHEPLFTGLATTPKEDINGTLTLNALTCFSVLKPAEDVILTRGWYAPAGSNGAELVRQLLSVGPAPIIMGDSSPHLSEAIIAEDGETNLSMADRILTAINWRLRIDGDGTVNIIQKSSDPVARLDPASNDVIETKVTVEADWYSAPNVYMAVSGGATGIARDDSPDSILSTVNRGREVWKYESGCALASNETIAEYAQRKLKDARKVSQKASYARRYIPEVMPDDVIMMNYPEHGLTGSYLVQSQSIEIGYCAKTTEQILKE